MTKPLTALTAVMESATLTRDKEGALCVSAKLSSFGSPARLGGLSGKGIGLDNSAGKRQTVGSVTKVAHTVDKQGSPRIKTILTVCGSSGLEKQLGADLTLVVIQRDLPGVGEAEDDENEG
jgi:hypothetical protein